MQQQESWVASDSSRRERMHAGVCLTHNRNLRSNSFVKYIDGAVHFETESSHQQKSVAKVFRPKSILSWIRLLGWRCSVKLGQNPKLTGSRRLFKAFDCYYLFQTETRKWIRQLSWKTSFWHSFIHSSLAYVHIWRVHAIGIRVGTVPQHLTCFAFFFPFRMSSRACVFES